jgi:predicted dehydrogenase
VAICTPNHTHAPITAAFLEAGIDVILDKPMTARLAEALAALQAKTGLVLGLTYAFAHHAIVRQAQAMVAAGMIGRVRQVHVEYVQEWPAGPADPDGAAVAWRRDPARAGRTLAAGDIGTHAHHLLKTISGLDLAELRADFHVCGAPKTPGDTAFVNLRMANGVPGLLSVTQVAPGNHCGLRVRLFGDAGGLEWDQEFPEQLRYALRGEPERIIHRGRAPGPPAARAWRGADRCLVEPPCRTGLRRRRATRRRRSAGRPDPIHVGGRRPGRRPLRRHLCRQPRGRRRLAAARPDMRRKPCRSSSP